MAANFDFKLKVYNASGILQAQIVDFIGLAYRKEKNAPGVLQVELGDSHPIISQLQDLWQIEAWIKPPGGVWSADFYSFFEDPDYEDYNPYLFTATCPGQMSMLGWAICAWYASTDGRSAFTADPVETIMKSLVTYNLTASATTGAGRLYVGPNPGITVASDLGTGGSTSWSCAWKNILVTLQDLAEATGTNFTLTKTGAVAWTFDFSSTYIGSDLRGDKDISIDTIMNNPSYKEQRSKERTVAIIGGSGKESARIVATRTGDNFSSSRHREIFVNVNNSDDTAFLQSKGEQKLDKFKAKKELKFDISQVPFEYITDYNIGDITTVYNPYDGTSFDAEITAVEVSVENRQENNVHIQIEVEEYA
jgi:hypothetical protein